MRNRFLFFGLIVFGLFFYLPAAASHSDHLWISQVQITGGPGKTTNDFIEIYNPTGADIDLDGYRIVKRTKTGTSDTLIKSFTTSTIIKAHGFYLWANSSFADIAVVPDVTTTGSIAADNGVAIRNGPNDTGSIVDSVGWGEAANVFVEGTVFATSPAANEAFVRQQDTGNSAADFVLQAASPRNSQSPVSPALVSEEEEEEEESPSTGSGQSSGGGVFTLELSEILPNPDGADSGSEWIELYNSGGQAVDLSLWYLDDSGTADSPEKSAYQVPEGTSLGSLKYLAITISKGRFALNNSDGDTVRVFDEAKNLRLSLNYPGPARSGFSYARDSSGNWQWTHTLTPNAANSFAQIQEEQANTLRLSEVLPNPEGADEEGEFIEIFNFGTDSINLNDWVIADARKRYTITEEDFFETEIAAGGYFVLWREVTGIALNNSGEEEVSLYDPQGELISQIKFDAKGRGAESYAVIAQKFQWTSKVTAGKENEFGASSSEEESEQESLKEDEVTETSEQNQNTTQEPQVVLLTQVRDLELGTLIQTTGLISAPPGVFGEQVFYLAGSGIRVFLSAPLSYKLSLGDRVSLVGAVSLFHNELQLRVNETGNLQILESGQSVLPETAKTGEIGEAVEGFLVKIAGVITRSAGETFFIDDGTGEARIHIQEETGIKKPEMRKSDEVAVVGIVSQFNDNYRVLPRYQEDITTGSVAGSQALPRTGNNFWLVLAVLYSLCYIGFTVLLLNKPKILRE